MGATLKKFTVRLNNKDKIEQLLQENYDQACQSYNTIQNEINKIASTTVIKDLDIDGKEKYGKIMNNYIALQQKAITQKFDIAKLLSEIVKYNGDVKSAIEGTKQQSSTLDLAKLRELAISATGSKEATEEYKLKEK